MDDLLTGDYFKKKREIQSKSKYYRIFVLNETKQKGIVI